ncbi:MAG TPA: transposase [Candidatus Paceibacterota bacterium]|nr:transposase [Candidatus Paceibacterota bacterium]HRZ55093.1 transposase [Candidatus Paceibacterota bacterium]
MARKLRVEYAGAVYHLMNRGDRKEPIFRDDGDREQFLETLGEACVKTGWQVHAFCLMPNHFHLVVETPRANLVAGMKWFLGTYTGRFNRRHRLAGHVFSGRYKSLVVDGDNRGYLKTVCDYVHLNPVRAKLLRPEQPLREYRWSSWPEYMKRPGRRWPWLRVDRILGEYGIPKDSAAGRRYLERALEERRAAEAGADYRNLRRGWCWGARSFRKELLGQMKDRRGPEHYGSERHETAEALAEEIVARELKRRRWTEAELERRAKGDAGKVAIAVRLRAETVMTVKWIAQRLQMGAPGYVHHLLYCQRKTAGGAYAKLKN